jgi:hypothetical protein
VRTCDGPDDEQRAEDDGDVMHDEGGVHDCDDVWGGRSRMWDG